MQRPYGKETHALCRECGRKIFVVDVEPTEIDGKRMLELKCSQPGCVAYGKPTLYDDDALVIYGAAAG